MTKATIDNKVLALVRQNPGITGVQLRAELRLTLGSLRSIMYRLSAIRAEVKHITGYIDGLKTASYWTVEAAPEDARFSLSGSGSNKVRDPLKDITGSEFLGSQLAQSFGMHDAAMASLRLAVNTPSYYVRINE